MFTRRSAAGVTLIELIVAMVIVGVIATASIAMMRSSATAGIDPARRKQALLIAEGLMDEVLSAHFTYCDPGDDTAASAGAAVIGGGNCTAILEQLGPEAGNARPFDNVNDYGPNFSFVNGAGAVIDANGAVATPNGYGATVSINPVLVAADPLGPPGALGITSNATAPGMNALLVTVTVTYGAGNADLVRLDSYRTRYAPNDF
jgi:MSHA pilin protein MshD